LSIRRLADDASLDPVSITEREVVRMTSPFQLALRVLLPAVLVHLSQTAGFAQTVSPVRLEAHPVQTVTMTDEQFLTGSTEGAPVVIAGQLRLPGSGTGRLPAVVLLHGAGGISANIDLWAREFNSIGIATFVLDSYTGRGIVSVSENQTQLGRTPQINDAYRALELLAKHPRIDPARIAVMGFSRGGQAALYSSLTRFQRMHGPDGARFAAYVILYPPCNLKFIDDEQVGAQPIRIFHGTADDFVFVDACRAYAARLKKAGRDVQLTEYPGALHVFDGPHLKDRVFVARGQTTRRCAMEEGAGGKIINTATQQPFTYDDACVERGASVGYDADAYTKSLKAIKGFLSETFKLP
jgi:dienelactone hydrolase